MFSVWETELPEIMPKGGRTVCQIGKESSKQRQSRRGKRFSELKQESPRVSGEQYYKLFLCAFRTVIMVDGTRKVELGKTRFQSINKFQVCCI